jgi:DUF1009 family protein
MQKLGLIAGNRRFPLILAEAAKKKDYYLVAVAIKGDTDFRLRNYVDKIYWVNLNEFSRLFEIFKDEDITQIVMAGQISPSRLFSREVETASQIKDLLISIKDKRPDSIFGAIAEKLESAGFKILDSTLFMEEFLPKKGTLTQKNPDFNAWEDIYFGFDLAKAVAQLDIGQTVAVKNKAIVAVEAFEGTDSLIRRAGKIGRAGIVVVKVSKPRQDRRFDIPVVGLNTIKNLIRAHARSLAIEADKTLFIDKAPSIRLADKHGISIVAV